MRNLPLGILSFLVLATACQNAHQEAGSKETSVLNIYTHRHYDADRELYQLFEDQTGIAVNLSTASADELIQKMKMEGRQSPADVLITVDAGRLHRAYEADLLQAVPDSLLWVKVPPQLREENGYWFGFSQRARVLVYAKERLGPKELSTYEDLAHPRWRGRLLLRSSSNIYNQSLLASLIAHYGADSARAWAQGIVANMARRPQGGDRDQIKAVAAGEGDVAVVNTYYLAGMLNSEDPAERAAAQKLAVFYPNQNAQGTHTNISGMGMARYAPHRNEALQFMRFMLSAEAQQLITQKNYEFPVLAEVKASPTLRSWGFFEQDALPMQELGRYNKDAVMIFDEVNWP